MTTNKTLTAQLAKSLANTSKAYQDGRAFGIALRAESLANGYDVTPERVYNDMIEMGRDRGVYWLRGLRKGFADAEVAHGAVESFGG